MLAVYDTKLVLHIPHSAWEDGRLVDIDYPQFRKRLYRDLMAAGVTDWYMTEAVGCYKGRAYRQELLTIFCEKERRDTITGIFRETYLESRDIMKQEAFAYECDGALMVVPLLQPE